MSPTPSSVRQFVLGTELLKQASRRGQTIALDVELFRQN
jgi:hypothetical protein